MVSRLNRVSGMATGRQRGYSRGQKRRIRDLAVNYTTERESLGEPKKKWETLVAYCL